MQDLYNNYKEIGLFNKGDYLVFSFKKTEKIVSAIYLITSLIKDNEPIKWELRENSIYALSIMMSINSLESVDKNNIIQSFFSTSFEIISLLNISLVSGLLSSMNVSLIIKEINSLMDYLKMELNKSSNPMGFILSDNFFSTDIAPSMSDISDKGHIENRKGLISKDNKAFIDKSKKDNRKVSILNILKKDSRLTIKDFIKVITDCSEKTIQRELISLVEKGLVIRNGERRWSTYSLA